MAFVLKRSLIIGILSLTAGLAAAQPPSGGAPSPQKDDAAKTSPQSKPEEAAKKWYEKYSVRGYIQFRYNRLFSTNGQLTCEACDKSIGNANGVSIKRARVVLSGDINDRIYMYFQPDFATTSGGLNFGQIRDLYFDVALDKKKEFRFRVGQSKVPYGFEDMQSSSNRLPFDRSDAISSGVPGERDIGVFFYWAPEHIRKRFSHLTSSGLKGTGDYGVLGAGFYNGQGANRPEGNNNLHTVARVTYPWEIKGRFIEAGLQGYSGRYAVTSDQRSPGTLGPVNFNDRRVAGSFVVYPQPLGFQAEYNAGTGPEYQPATRTIVQHRLRGGYAMVMYMAKFEGHTITPYARYQYYSGGKKNELDARRYLVRELEAGVEWQMNQYLEWTGAYAHSDRTYEDAKTPNNRQKGDLFRLQMQVNF